MNINKDSSNRPSGVHSAITLNRLSVESLLMRLFVIAWVAFGFMSGEVIAKERYQPKNLTASADSFLSRADQGVVNVEFIIAHAINGAFHSVREGREPESALEGNSAGSVIIGAGTEFGDLVIINENEGDSIVVNK